MLGGIGWRGKNTLLLNKDHGSIFFLGVTFGLPVGNGKIKCNGSLWYLHGLYRNLPNESVLGPYKLNANRCISYLTIEHKGIIPIS